jgi:hypothetical protein
MADPITINVQSPMVDAPVSVNLGGILSGFRESVDDLVDDVKSGDSNVLSGLFLALMFLVVGVYVWRKV